MTLYARYRGWKIPIFDLQADPHLARIWDLADVLDLGFYDASYAYMALNHNGRLLHADERMRPKIESVPLIRSLWLADYAAR